MKSVSRAATHVGRVGALAVALGVGAAVVSGTGVAWADGTDGGSAPDQTSAGSTADSAAGTGSTARAASPRRASRTPSRPAAQADAGSPSSEPTASASRRPSVVVPAAAVALPTAAHSSGNSPAPTVTAAVPTSTPVPNVVAPQPVRIAVPAAAVLPASTTPTAPVRAAAVAVAPVAALVTTPVVTVVNDPVAHPAAAPVTQTVTAPPRTLVSRLLTAVGLDPLGVDSAPGTPVESPALWALLGWTRRQSARTLVGSSAAAASASTLPTAAVTTSAVTTLPTNHIGWVTGQSNNGIPGLGWTQTNNTAWAGVYGTDVGVMWFNGLNGYTQLAFGDTFSGPNMTGNWRSNVLLLSNDRKLYDGLSLINTGYANQFIPAARNQVFFIGSEVTNIPTSAVFVPTGATDPNTGLTPGENYVSYMSVKSWDSPGRWTTNYSGVSKFIPGPNGGQWVLQTSTVRSAGWFRSSTPYRAGDQNFQQMAYVLEPESQVASTGGVRYVYAFGTPSGRQGSAYLSRVPEASITDLKQYEYWDGKSWVKDKPAVATEVIGPHNSTGLFGFIKDLANNPNFFGGWFAGLVGPKTGGNVSEMSVQYNEYLGKYVMMYGDGNNNVQLRYADTPEGTWSDPIQVASSALGQYPGLYAPMIHPLSGTGKLSDSNNQPDVSNLYWNMSLWGNYNVVLMKTDLSPLHAALNPTVV